MYNHQNLEAEYFEESQYFLYMLRMDEKVKVKIWIHDIMLIPRRYYVILLIGINKEWRHEIR